MAFSLNDNHIVVKYHYIDNPREDRRAFYPCPIKEFERQIIFLKNNFKITTVENVFNAAQENSSEKMCALTFDDGLKDNYQNAIPILKKHRVTGTFFPITKTFEGFLPATHAMHILLSSQSSEDLVGNFNTFLSATFPDMVGQFYISKTKRLTMERKMYDDVSTANLKETMNRVPRNIRDTFLEMIFKELGLDKEKISSALFMTPLEIKDLYRKGYLIGSHAHSHEALDTTEESLAWEEIRTSKKILKELLGTPVTVLVYPQSGPKIVPQAMLKEEGLRFALSTERRGVLKGDDPYLIPRYDTNDIRDFLDTTTL
ncbi:MAG TPA: polysaccharide deacetylase family protein [Candidatus Paceibacterota bacterium]